MTTNKQNDPMGKVDPIIDFSDNRFNNETISLKFSQTYTSECLDTPVALKPTAVPYHIKKYIYAKYPNCIISSSDNIGSNLKFNSFTLMRSPDSGYKFSTEMLNKLSQSLKFSSYRSNSFGNIFKVSNGDLQDDIFISDNISGTRRVIEIIPLNARMGYDDTNLKMTYKEAMVYVSKVAVTLEKSDYPGFYIQRKYFNDIIQDAENFIWNDVIKVTYKNQSDQDVVLWRPVPAGGELGISISLFPDTDAVWLSESKDHALTRLEEVKKLYARFWSTLSDSDKIKWIFGIYYMDPEDNSIRENEFYTPYKFKFVLSNTVREFFRVNSFSNDTIVDADFNINNELWTPRKGIIDFKVVTVGKPFEREDNLDVELDYTNETEEAISFLNNVDQEQFTPKVFEAISKIDDKTYKMEEVQPVLSALVAMDLDNGKLPELDDKSVEKLKEWSVLSDEIRYYYLLVKLNDFSRSTAINNVTTILNQYKDEFQKLKNIKVSDIKDLSKVRNMVNETFFEYENQFDKLENLKNYSRYEKSVAIHRNEKRPRLENNFNDFELSLKSYLVNIKGWFLRKAIKADEYDKFYSKYQSWIENGAISYTVRTIGEGLAYLGKAVKIVATATLNAVSSALAVVDDIYDFIAKTRLPISFNSGLSSDNFFPMAEILDNGKSSIQLKFLKEGKSSMFIPDYTGRKFGDLYWKINTDNLPIFKVEEFGAGDYNRIRITDISGNTENLIKGWMFNLDPIYEDYYKDIFRKVKKITKRYPYLGYATLLSLQEQNFNPSITGSEKGIASAVVILQTAVAITIAVASAHGIIGRLIAAILAAITVSSANAIAAMNFFKKFSDNDTSSLLTNSYYDNSSEYQNTPVIYHPINGIAFLPWSETKWLMQVGFLSAKLAIAFAGSAAIGKMSGKIGDSIFNIARKRQLKKAFLKSQKQEVCVTKTNKKTGESKQVCKMKKVVNPNRFIELPDGSKLKLTKQEMYDKIAFDTFVTYKSNGSGSVPQVPDFDTSDAEYSNPENNDSFNPASNLLSLLQGVNKKSDSINNKSRILNKKLGLKTNFD